MNSQCDTEDPKDTESSEHQPWLTRFGIWSLLVGNLLAIVGTLVFWNAGGNMAYAIVGFVVAVAIVAAILMRR